MKLELKFVSEKQMGQKCVQWFDFRKFCYISSTENQDHTINQYNSGYIFYYMHLQVQRLPQTRVLTELRVGHTMPMLKCLDLRLTPQPDFSLLLYHQTVSRPHGLDKLQQREEYPTMQAIILEFPGVDNIFMWIEVRAYIERLHMHVFTISDVVVFLNKALFALWIGIDYTQNSLFRIFCQV